MPARMPAARRPAAVWPLAAGGATVALLAALIAAAGSALPLAPDARRALAGTLVVACYAAFCGWIAARRRAAAAPAAVAGAADADTLLVAYASQTGFAEQIARRTAQALEAAGLPVRLASLAALGGSALQQVRKALFVVSTTGEGDAPDSVAGFARRTLACDLPLDGLDYGVLALGDRSYRHYCAFGHALDQWLHRQGARPMFDTIEVDDGDEGALRHWQHYLGVLGAGAHLEDWAAPSYGRWMLVERRLLNPGSPGAPAYHLALVPADGAPCAWQAGDIAEIGPRNDAAMVDAWLAPLRLDGGQTVPWGGAAVPLREALAGALLPHGEEARALHGLAAQRLVEGLAPIPHREYSIASLPGDGRLELLVRQMRYPDGRLGLGSGWLTRHAPVGGSVDLRIRPNTGFHPPAPQVPLILIGNGTGMAGLRAHLKARAAAGAARNWLLFGERTAAHDFFFGDEIRAWREQGLLARMDLAFSRDGGAHRYVQDCLAGVEAPLRAWVDEGAAIYVCGSLQGMAAGVGAELARILGRERLDDLAAAGRYRRDVY